MECLETNLSAWRDSSGDAIRTENEYAVKDGLTMDEATIAVFYIDPR